MEQRLPVPLGIATASLDVLNAVPGYAFSHTHVYAVPGAPEHAAPPAAPHRRTAEAVVPHHAIHAATCPLSLVAPDALLVARVVRHGYELELRVVCGGMADDAPPTTFRFPAPILANVGVLEDAGSGSLHVLAATAAGILYRLVMPLRCVLRGAPLPRSWARPHAIHTLRGGSGEGDAQTGGAPARTLTSVHVVDAGLVLLACADGALIQLQQAHGGDAGHTFEGEWRESVMRPASFLQGMSRLFGRGGAPASPGGSAAGSAARTSPTHTLALATHVRVSDPALAFCICADRRMRVWNMATETCVRTLELPASYEAAEGAARGAPRSRERGTPAPEDQSDAWERTSAPRVLLMDPGDAAPYALCLVVFVPAHAGNDAFIVAYGVELEESSAWSGGLGEIALLHGRPCDTRTRAPDVELRDMALTRTDEGRADAWNVWLLWHAGGTELLQRAPLLLDTPAGDGGERAVARAGVPDSWTTTSTLAQHAPLRGPEFDAALAELRGTQELAQFFLARLLEPGRMSTSSLHLALRAFQRGQRTPGTEAHVDDAPLPPRSRVVQQIAACVGAACVLEHDPASGAPLYDKLHDDTRNAWLHFARLAEQTERSARWPLLIAPLTSGALVLVSRHALSTLLRKDAAVWLGDMAARLAGASQHPERALSRAIGELASDEYAAVLNDLHAQPTVPPAHGYAAVRAGGVPLLQLGALAAELRFSLGARAPALLDHALLQRCRAIGQAGGEAGTAGSAAAAVVLPRFGETAYAKVQAFVEERGGQALLSTLEQLREVVEAEAPEHLDGVQTEPAAAAFHAAAAADAAAQALALRHGSAQSLIVLVVCLMEAAAPVAREPLQRVLNSALRTWQHTTSLYALTRADGEREPGAAAAPGGDGDQDALVAPLHELRLGEALAADTERPVVHLLHRLAHAHAITCTLRPAGAAFTLRLALGAPGAPKGSAAPEASDAAPDATLALARSMLCLGFPSAARTVLAHYASDVPSDYLRALALAQTARAARADALLERAGALLAAPASAARERLLKVVPAAVAQAGEGAAQHFAFWTHAALHLEAAQDVRGALRCYLRALEAPAAARAEPGAAASAARDVWSRVFRAQLALGEYEAAAATVLAVPFEDLQQVCLQSLVTTLCEADAVSTLLRCNFLHLQAAVERTLSFKARNAPPLARPNYFDVLYAYHVARGDYKSAAASMYQHARRLRLAALAGGDTRTGGELAVRQAHSLLAASNALALLPPANAWFAHAVSEEEAAAAAAAGPPPAGGATAANALRGSLTHYIPEEHFARGARPVAIMQLGDVRREYDELLARLSLMRTYPELTHPGVALRAEDAVNLHLATDDVDAAFSTARALGVDQCNVFDVLARKCVVLEWAARERRRRLGLGSGKDEKAGHAKDDSASENPAAVALRQLAFDDQDATELEATFLRRSPRAASWSGPSEARAWRYLQLQLAMGDAAGPVAAVRHRAAAVDRILALGAQDVLPGWLHDWFRTTRPDALLRAYMRHGLLLPALTLCTRLVQDATSEARTSSSTPLQPPPVWLPYTLMDSVLAAADAAETDAADAAKALRAAIDTRSETLQRQQRELAPRRPPAAQMDEDAPPTAALRT